MKNMKMMTAAILASASLAAPAFAGSLAEPVVERPVMAPPVVAASRDWTGFYLGAALGHMSVGGDAVGSDITYGGFAGYNHDFGRFVLGGEVQYDGMNFMTTGGPVNGVFRAKLRGGFGVGNALVYGVVGAANLSAAGTNGWGYLGGVGVDFAVAPDWTVGVEALYHQFDNFAGTGNNLNATTVSARVAYRF